MKTQTKILAVCAMMLVIAAATVAQTLTVRMQQGKNLYSGSVYSGGEDIYLREAYPDYAGGKFTELHAGFENYNGGGRVRSLIRFDLTSMKSDITAATTIAAARLKVRLYGVSGTAITGKTVTLYRVSTANKGWRAGTSSSRTMSETGACCWNYRFYDPTYVDPSCMPTCIRHEGWAGSKGLGTSGIDVVAQAVATATVGSTDVGSDIVFVFNSTAFLSSWINDNAANEGFLISCNELETGTTASYTDLKFASCENPTADARPMLEIDFDNFQINAQNGVVYTLPQAARVSMNIRNSAGLVVKELTFAADRAAGLNFETWDCKDDPAHLSDSAMVVPDGEYLVKGLVTQGLQAEALMCIGQTGTPATPAPGTHVSPGAIAVDATGLYIAGYVNESNCDFAKYNKSSDAQLWFWQNWPGSTNGPAAMVSSGDTVYLDVGGAITLASRTQPRSLGTWNLKLGGESNYSDTIDKLHDIAVRNGKIVVSSPSAGKIGWVNKANGTVSSSVAVANVRGVALDETGANAYVISGTTVIKFAYGAITSTTLISGLTAPVRLDVNPTNGDIYVAENGTSNQVKLFSKTGTPIRTIGTLGGYKLEGKWRPAVNVGFFRVIDITVDADGNFYVSEPWSPLRRVGKYTAAGAFEREWYAGGYYATNAAVDPGDLTSVWVEQSYGTNDAQGKRRAYMNRCIVNWQTKTFTVDGIYCVEKGVFGEITSGHHWRIMRRGGKVYVVREGEGARVLYFDQAADSLRPIAAARNNFRGWQGLEPAPDTMLNAEWPQKYYTWCDRNGDGRPARSEMWLGYNDSMPWFPRYPDGSLTSNAMLPGTGGASPTVGFTDSNFNFYSGLRVYPNRDLKISAPTVLGATLETIGGVPTPNYDFKNLYTMPYENIPAEYCREGVNGPMNEILGVLKDRDGNTFAALNGELKDLGGEYFGANMWSQWCGNNSIAKWGPDKKLLWRVGRHAAGNIPAPGEIMHLRRMLGTAHGCVMVGDNYQYTYTYDQDGLWVGKLLDDVTPSTVNWSTFGVCDEQYGGTIFEVTDNNTPGLAMGDVIFLAGGKNTVNAFKITGWNSFNRFSKTLTVTGGKIAAQSEVGVINSNKAAATRGALLTVNSGRREVVIALGRTAPVSLEIYSAIGRKVAVLVDNSLMQSGIHQISFDAQQKLAKGYYMAVLKVDGRQIVQPMCIIR